MTMDRRNFLAGLLATFPAAGFAGPPVTAVRPLLRNPARIAELASASSRRLDPALAAVTGFVLLDGRNVVIDSYQADIRLPPASVTKTVTALYARSVLGADYRFSTRVFASGPVKDGMIQGDLYLVGGGDPALDSDELALLVSQLTAQGIRGITGRYYVDAAALPDIPQIDASQPDYLGYNAAISGLNLNFNRVYFEWEKTGDDYRLTLDARAEENRPSVNWITIEASSRRAPVFVYRNVGGHDRWSVARSALGKKGGRWLPVRQPADYCGDVFRTLASAAGLALPAHQRKTTPAAVREIARFDSKPLREVIRWLLKYSNNMTAECLGLTASRALGQDPQTLLASSQIMDRWAGDNLGAANLGFINHSGLTDRVHISPRQLAMLLATPQAKTGLSGELKPFKLLDRNGDIVPSASGNVFAKTGSLNFTRALAGYLEKGGQTYTFAIFAADLPARAAIPAAARENPRGARLWARKAHRQEQAIVQNWLANM